MLRNRPSGWVCRNRRCRGGRCWGWGSARRRQTHIVYISPDGVRGHRENRTLAVRATLGCHAVKRAVYKDHIINRLSTLMFRAAKAVESRIARSVGVNHEYSARAIVTPIGGSSVKLGINLGAVTRKDFHRHDGWIRIYGAVGNLSHRL